MITSSKDFTLIEWARRLLSGKPHLAIGAELNDDNPYMLRWYVIPRNRRLNIYVHKFMRSDDDRALHDHPWWFVSLLLRGSYAEVTERNVKIRHTGSIAFRPAEWRHRVALLTAPTVQTKPWAIMHHPVPCWTLIITGPKSRLWGFWCRKERFVPWNEWDIDAGCGED